MNPVVHFEMPAEDRKRMSDFYSRVFGWKTNQLGPDMGNYITVATGPTDEQGRLKITGTINGGFYEKTVDMPEQYPSVVIAVEDIDRHIKMVADGGGKVLGEPMEIPGVGRYVSFYDTEGNRVSILQPLAMPNQELWAKSDSATRFTVKRDELRVEMERVYDASPERVFNAFIDSDLVSKWWGPRGTTTIVDKNEVRPGGAWRFVVRSRSGKEEAFNGKYVEIKPHASITHTFNYEPIGPGHELKETATFQPVENGKTKVTTTSFYDRIEELDGMVGSGMEKGAVETFERLAELLEATK